MSNGFLTLTLDLLRPSLVSLKADFLGQGKFSGTQGVIMPEGLRLESVSEDGTVRSSTDADNAQLRVSIISNFSEYVAFSVSGVVDHVANPAVNESWFFSLRRIDRTFAFTATGQMLPIGPPTISIRRALHLNALSIYALFDRGVVQMKNAKPTAGYFGSTGTLPRLYALGGGTALDITRTRATGADSDVLSDAGGGMEGGQEGGVTLLSGSGSSGLHEVLSGRMPKLHVWSDGALTEHNETARPRTVLTAQSWKTEWIVAPNDRNFPSGSLTTGPNLPIADLEALMTGIYASSPGCLCTYDNEVVNGERVAQIATTIARPDRGYSGTYNYFDPDNFISLSALIYSGDEYLQRQARDVLMRSGAFLRVSDDNLNGELPHHFVKDKPTYTALSGAIQTGPVTNAGFELVSCE